MNTVMAENTKKSNKRLFFGTLIIIIIANISTAVDILTGSASEGVSFLSMGKEAGLAAVLFIIDGFVCKHYGERNFSKYISVTVTAGTMFLFDVFFPGAKDMYANLYLVMGLSLLYFDIRVSVYAFFAVVAAHSLMLILEPSSFPYGNVEGALIARYICFLLFGIASVIVARVSAELLRKTIAQVNDLSEMSRGVVKKADQLAFSSEKLHISASESSSASEQVKSQIESLTQAATNTASYASNTTMLVSKMAMSLTSVASNMDSVNMCSLEFKDIVEKGHDLIQNQVSYTNDSKDAQVSVNEAIGILSKKSIEIEEIIIIISQIASKTKLLALNAAIEAARAGEAGRSFAVVADEIRNLAIQSADAAENISDLIKDIQVNTAWTNEKILISDKINNLLENSVFKIQEQFAQINTGADSIYGSVHETASLVQEMLSCTDNVVRDITDISSATEETASSSEEIAVLSEQQAQTSQTIIKMSENLASSSNDLRQMVAQLNYF